MELDQVDQRLPGHHHLHLREELLQFGLLIGGGELVIEKPSHGRVPLRGVKPEARIP